MQDKTLIYAAIAIILVIGGYYLFNMQANQTPENPSTASQDMEVESTLTPTATEITLTPSVSDTTMQPIVVQLTAQNNSAEMGTATLTEQGGNKTRVVIDLLGAPQATPQPAHIHIGACPTPGAVKYPLSNVVNGKSTTILDVTIAQLKTTLPLAINVHKSVGESSVYVSCGDMKF